MVSESRNVESLDETQDTAGRHITAAELQGESNLSFGQRFNYTLTDLLAHEVATECVVVTVGSGGRLSPAAGAADRLTDGMLTLLIQRGTLTGTFGFTLLIPTVGESPVRSVLVAGSGDIADHSDRRFRELVQTVYRQLTAIRVTDAALFLAEIAVGGRTGYWHVRQQIVAIEEEAYRYRRGDCDVDDPVVLKSVTLAGSMDDSKAVPHGCAIASAVNTTRTLADMPPNACTPVFLAGYAESLANRFSWVSADVLTEEDMADLGMHAMLSVGSGSAQPSTFAVLKYCGAGAADRPLVLIGKGVTFDTGGTSVKSREGMKRMKYDMCGAAAVIGALEAAAMLELPLNVIGIAACAENMPGGNATRPSDVVTSMSGKTVEILNPDAEGRLLLCDALTYAERFNPAAVIDVATLTGASLVALGRHYSALFATDSELADALRKAGESTMDNVWQLPLSERDMSQLDSQFADLSNMGDGTAGCIVAALFLSRFAESYPWAHLDVSNTAKKHGDEIGATGRPAALLVQYLLTQAECKLADDCR